MALTTDNITRLKSQLQTTGLSGQNNPLFQVVDQLIDAQLKTTNDINTQLFPSSGGGGINDGSFITIDDNSSILPNSVKLVAGPGIQLGRSKNKLTINVNIPKLIQKDDDIKIDLCPGKSNERTGNYRIIGNLTVGLVNTNNAPVKLMVYDSQVGVAYVAYFGNQAAPANGNGTAFQLTVNLDIGVPALGADFKTEIVDHTGAGSTKFNLGILSNGFYYSGLTIYPDPSGIGFTGINTPTPLYRLHVTSDIVSQDGAVFGKIKAFAAGPTFQMGSISANIVQLMYNDAPVMSYDNNGLLLNSNSYNLLGTTTGAVTVSIVKISSTNKVTIDSSGLGSTFGADVTLIANNKYLFGTTTTPATKHIIGINGSNNIIIDTDSIGTVIGSTTSSSFLNSYGIHTVIGTTGNPNYTKYDNTVNGGRKWRVGDTGAATTGFFSIYNETGAILTLSIDATGRLNMNKPIGLAGYTVATLPAGATSDTAFVIDALGPVFGSTVVGGGAAKVPVYYDGTNWIVG